jgi:hypothetical protein
MRLAGGCELKGADQAQGLLAGGEGERDGIGVPAPLDRHGDLVVGDTVEVPGALLGERLHDVDGVHFLGIEITLDDAHARSPWFGPPAGRTPRGGVRLTTDHLTQLVIYKIW